jgi:hypothetical protein
MSIQCRHQWVPGSAPNWLITVDIGRIHGSALFCSNYSQSRAVVDDFGTLVIVRAWI